MATMTKAPVRHRGFLALAGGILLLIGACADVKPMAYTEIHEISSGPGLLSGADGEFVLYGN